jgi:hypothetical protein
MRRVIAILLLVVAFIALGRITDRTATYLLHAGLRGFPVVFFWFAALTLAYLAFAACISYASITSGGRAIHIIATVVFVVWLFLRSTVTAGG